ncbi:hypothetical protein JDS87_05575 [Bacillus cereus]|uniref:hypothetical protein n=1 Tax=Bacillus cereus TaxID=1396 RepID=UPI0018F2A986|nr:hypothetical protein [Bacillus cereus]MBJ8051491.1 hypothetical protein [Bacillus cereus]
MHEKISIKTMTDYHLYDFMRCPHKFYFRHIKRREPSSFEWQQLAQMIVNQIINEYYTLPAGQQTKIVLLILIEKYWKKVRISMFASKIEGTKYEYIPKQEDIITGMDDLFRMKEMLQQPEHYTERHFRSECMSCAFRGECQVEEAKEETLQKKNIVH